MKHYILLVISVIVLASLTASGILTFGAITPELLLVFVLCYTCVEERCVFSLLFAAICGLIMGALGGRGILFSILWYFYAALACYFGSRKTGFAKISRALLFVLLFTGVGELLFYAVYFMRDIDFAAMLQSKLLPAVLYNSICTVVLFYPVKRLFRSKEEKDYTLGEDV